MILTVVSCIYSDFCYKVNLRTVYWSLNRPHTTQNATQRRRAHWFAVNREAQIWGTVALCGEMIANVFKWWWNDAGQQLRTVPDLRGMEWWLYEKTERSMPERASTVASNNDRKRTEDCCGGIVRKSSTAGLCCCCGYEHQLVAPTFFFRGTPTAPSDELK